MSYSLPTPFTPDSGAFAALDPSRCPSDANTNTTIAITALARFEFEAGKANDGTKILMIEWEDDSRGSFPGGSWHVAWEGKQAVLPADEKTNDHTRRLYFLLPPHVTIPPAVTLSYELPSTAPPPPAAAASPPDPLHLNPLPAIFPPELGADGRSAGKKGVLHTIWAKKRLQVLEHEINHECRANAEGIALHMALQEKEWIESNFGVSLSAERQRALSQGHPDPHYPMGPATPVSPSSSSSGGGKLGDKLKGLKLQTSERELSPKDGHHHHHAAAAAAARHLLSPASPDVAVSSFNSFHGMHPSPVSLADSLRTVVHYPPESVQEQQNAAHDTGFATMGMGISIGTGSAESGEELFAKALSPRTPDLPRSPFSFGPVHM
ncbi:hypothetical protein BO70DRAFT_287497 [Aspergillus heteromorphus CBS 117.55]|uniref:Uncharacterized protein n=1 Tax=Aspergillus heteromorphus CBS 117.55 TaxID=1448321 RepID=A0A317WN01_9EURO|nr:uncharacterized protein BO70DRAFT_287497 [Aspergillus heteromorphus CBS 117.55]PWY87779.1 hypothetical protein BO70DRAFT_287497 [Aspergillus heteromorphus CBS 117.55]